MSNDVNKAVIRKLEAALNAGQADAGLDVWAEDLTWNGQHISPAAIGQMRAPLWAAVPDIRFTLERAVAEGDWVAAHWTVRGTHTGEFAHPALGSGPASGRPVAFSYMDHYRIADGRIAEAWEVRDGLALLQQFGVIPTPGQATG